MPDSKSAVVMDADRISRTLTRIAHEIVERNKGVDDLALVGIRTRGVHIARASRGPCARSRSSDVPTGALDITLYRDDLMRHAVGPQPVVRRTEIPFSLDDKKILLVDDVLYTGRTTRAALDALIDFGRPKAIQLIVARRSRAPRAADQGRLRRKESADEPRGKRAGAAAGNRRARRGRCCSRRPRYDERFMTWNSSRRSPRSRSKDLLGIADMPPEEITLVLDTADAMKEIATRPIKKVPALRGKTVVNLFFEPSTRTRTSFEIAEKRLERRHAEHRDRDLERGQGRDARRHRA